MRMILRVIAGAAVLCLAGACGRSDALKGRNEAGERMMFADSTRTGRPMSKDPHVIFFKDRYFLYYSMPPASETEGAGAQSASWAPARPAVPGWTIGIATSTDLIHWEKAGEVYPEPLSEPEKLGYCAPCARVIGGKVHLFYQSYGRWAQDAICHATSDDGLNFRGDPSNPIFAPEPSDWSCGRAIDAEVVEFKGKYYLYFATRDPEFKIQLQGVAVADGGSDFSRGSWTLAKDAPILAPELPWEQECIEGASVIENGGRLFMFYAGAYNNHPQQIGVAVSSDGVNWERLQDEPFLANGPEGAWNSSESGHPHIFEAPDGRTYLFFQGNCTNGSTWYISQKEVLWKGHGRRCRPYLKP